ncbi:hypothetical protein D3C85_555660 [compost metagenome]
MTPEDRKKLSLLLEKAKEMSTLKKPELFLEFIGKCIEAARRRDATQYVQRFTDMRNSFRLAHQAFSRRREMGGKLSATGRAVVSWAFFPGIAK